MTREEEIIQAAKQKEKESEFTQIVKDAKGVNSSYGIGFLEGAEWADENQDKSFRWIKNSANNKPQLRHSVLMKTTHGIAEGEWQGSQWLQYRWSSKLEDKEVLYWIELYWLEQDLPKEE